MARTLEASGRYRVLRRLEAPTHVAPPEGVKTRTAIFLDVETTGLDPRSDDVIELAMAPFTYSLDGRVFGVGPVFQSFNQPRAPISPEITAITGITNDMVAGCRIDPAAVAAFAAPASLIIAHNAAFDRRFTERLSPVFTTKPWACSMAEVDWRSEGFEGAKLDYLALQSGFFYDKHRAVTDCMAAIALLAAPLPRSGATALSRLLDRARRPNWRLWAENAPFDFKDALKARGYRWNAEAGDGPRAWYVDVEDEVKERELAYLRTEIYQADVDVLHRRITAVDRFSDRC